MAQNQLELFDEHWDEAIEKYNRDSGRDIRKELSLRGLHSTEDLALKIEAAHKDFQGFRGKDSKLRECLRTALRPIRLCGQLLQASTALTPLAPASMILGSVLFLFDCARGVSNAYDSIYDLFKLLEDVTARMEVYNDALIDPKLQQILITISGTMLQIIGRAEKLIKRGHVKQYLYVTMLGKDDKVEELLADLRRYIDSESRMVVALMSATTQRMERGVAWIAKTLEGSSQKAEEDNVRSFLEKNLKTVACDKVYEIQQGLERNRIAGIGQWLIDQSLFQSWKEHDCPLLWLSGIRGSGKSFMSSCVVSALQKLHPQNQGIYPAMSVGYFYVKEDSETLQSSNTLLKTLAYQIAKNDKLFERHAAKICSDSDNLRICEDTWKTLFEEVFLSGDGDSSAVIVIDALDEAPFEERERLWKILRAARFAKTGSGQFRLRLLLVGRTDKIKDEVNKYWSGRPHPTIEVTARNNSSDVDLYIEKNLPRVRNLKNPTISIKKRVKLREKIRSTLKDGAMGTFLWVRLVFEQIKDQSRVSGIEKTLDTAPKELFALIEDMIERLATDRNRRKDDLNELLLWITFARREMLLGECRLVLMLKPPINDGMLDLEDTLRGPYASFFELIREDGKTTEDLQKEQLQQKALHYLDDPDAMNDRLDELDEMGDLSDDEDDEDDQDHGNHKPTGKTETDFHGSDISTTKVQFTHARIRDYLLQADLVKGIGVDANETHVHITIMCLQFLTDEIAKVVSNPWENSNLLDYAAGYFIDHLSDIERESISNSSRIEISRLLHLLFTDNMAMERWFLYGGTNVMSDSLIYRKGSCEVIQEWLLDPVYLDTLMEDRRAEVKRRARSPIALLKPVARVLALSWLEFAFDSEEALDFLIPFSVFWRDKRTDVGEEVTPVNRTAFRKLTVTDILSAADCVEMERNTLWHQCMGSTMRDVGHVEAAKSEYQKSIALWPQNPRAHYGLAVVYATQGYFREAIDEALVAIREMALFFEDEEEGKESKEEDGRAEEQSRRVDESTTAEAEPIHKTVSGTSKVEGLKAEQAEQAENDEKTGVKEEGSSDEKATRSGQAGYVDKNTLKSNRTILNEETDLPENDELESDIASTTASSEIVIEAEENHLLLNRADWDLAEVWKNISSWRASLGNYDEAIEAARSAFDVTPTNLENTFQVMKLLNQFRRYQDAVDFALELDQIFKTTPQGLSQLNLYMLGYRDHLSLARAFGTTGQVEILKKIYEKLIDSLDPSQQRTELMWQQARLGFLLFAYTNDETEAMDLWDTVLDGLLGLADQRLDWDGKQALEVVVMGLSRRRLWGPFASDLEQTRCNTFVDKVERLVRIEAGSQSRTIEVSNTEHVSISLGSWYRSQGRHKESKACFRPYILAALGILSDDILENDSVGWYAISRFLAYAGDEKNASAASGVQAMSLERFKKARETRRTLHSPQVQAHSNDEDTASSSKSAYATEVSRSMVIPSVHSRPEKDQDLEDLPESVTATKSVVHQPPETATPTFPISVTNQQTTEAHTEAIDTTLDEFYTFCDGPCTRPREDWQTLHKCLRCPDIDFCDECFALIRSDSFPYKMCGKDHPFLQTYPIAREITELACHKVDGITLPRKEWLEEIRAAWME